MKSINPHLFAVAREFRGFTQNELAERSGIPQSVISKTENGSAPIDSDRIVRLAEALGFPVEFFERKWPEFAMPLALYRRRLTMPMPLIRQADARLNVVLMHVLTMLEAFEPIKTKVRQLDPRGYQGGIEEAANDLRLKWGIRPGPILNATQIVESAGVIIVPFDFPAKIDGVNVWREDLPPIIFLNRNMPADRWRFTLCHELGHLTFHHLHLPGEKSDVEDEADRFASEFLMPSEDIRPYFRPKMRLEDFAALKLVWKVSIAALVMKAAHLEVVSEAEKRRLFAQLAARGFTKMEPVKLEKEHPSALRTILEQNLKLCSNGTDGLAKRISALPEDLEWMYPEVCTRNINIIRADFTRSSGRTT